MDPLDPLPYEADHFLLDDLPREGQDAWLSVAASDLWDGVMRAQTEAVSRAKGPRQALDEGNAFVQRALDQAWIFVPLYVPR